MDSDIQQRIRPSLLKLTINRSGKVKGLIYLPSDVSPASLKCLRMPLSKYKKYCKLLHKQYRAISVNSSKDTISKYVLEFANVLPLLKSN